jgi:hypothetical protein
MVHKAMNMKFHVKIDNKNYVLHTAHNSRIMNIAMMGNFGLIYNKFNVHKICT